MEALRIWKEQFFETFSRCLKKASLEIWVVISEDPDEEANLYIDEKNVHV